MVQDPVFPPNTDLVLPAPGGRLSLVAQRDPVRETLYCAFNHAYRSTLFVNPFPHPTTRLGLGIKWLVKGANDAGHPIVGVRARANPQGYGRPLITVVRDAIIYLSIHLLISHINIRSRLAPLFSACVSSRQRSELCHSIITSRLHARTGPRILSNSLTETLTIPIPSQLTLRYVSL